jgi:hypothetical protein
MSRYAPLLRSVTLILANTQYNLYSLLSALDVDTPKKACYVQLQFDPAAGGDLLYIGNSGVADISANYGASLVATQAWQSPSYDSNLILLSNILLRSNGASHVVGCTIVTR